MGNLNKVQLIGNLTADPEVRTTGDNRTIANCNLATNESWKDKNGNKQERVEFHRVVVFGNLAPVVEKYLSKGSKVYFEGKLQTNKWQDKDGNNRYTTEIVVDQRGQMQMLSAKDTKPAYEAPDNETFDDDIPF